MAILRPLLILSIFVSANVYGQEAGSKLPGEVSSFLSQRFHGWKLAEIAASARPEFIEFTRGVFIKGDFDGNGQMDYAVYITHGRASKRKISVVALLRKGGKLRPYTLETGEATSDEKSYSYLACVKKGEKGYNYETDRKFIYAYDTIFVGFWEKGGSSYVYRNGRFKAIITSD